MRGIVAPRVQKVALGRVVVTAAVAAAIEDGTLSQGDVTWVLLRHAMGDWGDLDRDDWASNDRALKDGGRLFSSYKDTPAGKLYVITEADRSATTVLFPSDY